MKCPACKEDAPCKDSRPMGDGRRRRYVCYCGTRFTTYEMVTDEGDNRLGLGGRGNKVTKADVFLRKQVAEAMNVEREQLRARVIAALDAQ
jgi:transcriptional regulator NrdR family protein